MHPWSVMHPLGRCQTELTVGTRVFLQDVHDQLFSDSSAVHSEHWQLKVIKHLPP